MMHRIIIQINSVFLIIIMQNLIIIYIIPICNTISLAHNIVLSFKTLFIFQMLISCVRN